MYSYRNFLIAAALASVACGPEVVTTDTEAVPSTGADTGSTGVPTTGVPMTGESTGEPMTSTTGDDTTTGSTVVTCVASPQDHGAACPDPCPITVDLEIGCDDDRFGIYGLRVAPAPDTTWLVTSSDDAALLFRADAVDAVRQDVAPEGFIDSGIVAALDPAGELHLVADATQQPDYEGGLLHVAEADGWSPTLLFDPPSKYVDVLALEVSPEGTPMVWLETDPPDGHSLAVPDGQGGWQLDVAPSAGVSYRNYSLAANGLPVAAALNSKDMLWYVLDGVKRQLSDELLSFTIPGVHYRLAYPPAPGAPLDVPQVATALYDDDGLHVAWSLMDDGFEQVDFAGTQAPKLQCFFEWNGRGSCPKSACLESAIGVEREAYSLARTGDGTLWLAVVTTTFDQTVVFTEMCRDDFGCFCDRETTLDLTRGELRLIRVATDGTPPIEVFTLPIDDIDIEGTAGDGDTERVIDLRGFGDQLALGVMTRPPGGAPAIRLLRIDTAQIAP